MQNKNAQLSLTNPRDAKAYQKLFQFDVLTDTTLSSVGIDLKAGLYPAVCSRGEYETVKEDHRVAEGHESRHRAPSGEAV